MTAERRKQLAVFSIVVYIVSGGILAERLWAMSPRATVWIYYCAMNVCFGIAAFAASRTEAPLPTPSIAPMSDRNSDLPS